KAGSVGPLFEEIWRLFLVAMMAAMLAEAVLCLPKVARGRGAVGSDGTRSVPTTKVARGRGSAVVGTLRGPYFGQAGTRGDLRDERFAIAQFALDAMVGRGVDRRRAADCGVLLGRLAAQWLSSFDGALGAPAAALGRDGRALTESTGMDR